MTELARAIQREQNDLKQARIDVKKAVSPAKRHIITNYIKFHERELYYLENPV